MRHKRGKCHRPTNTPRQIIHIQRTIGVKLVIEGIDGDYFSVDSRYKLVVNHNSNVMPIGYHMTLHGVATDSTVDWFGLYLPSPYQAQGGTTVPMACMHQCH